MNYNVPLERIECSFLLSQSDSFYRKKKLIPQLVFKNMDASFPGLMCQIWSTVKSFSNYYNYTNFIKDYNCE